MDPWRGSGGREAQGPISDADVRGRYGVSHEVDDSGEGETY